MDMKAQMAQAEEQFGIGKGNKSDWLTKFEAGDTRLRLLTAMEVLPQHYIEGGYKGICIGKDNHCPGCEAEDKAGIKWLGLVLHDGAIKPAMFPHTVAQQIASYQSDPEWGFEEPPMPYDITITKEKTGPEKQNVKYVVKPSPKMEPVAEAVLADLAKHNTPMQIKDAMKAKKMKELGMGGAAAPEEGGIKYPDESINPEDIPF